MRGKLLVSMPLIVLSACSSTKNVSLKHSDPAMVNPARFEQELAECRAWAEGTPSQGGQSGEVETLPADISDYGVSVCLRGKGYVRVDADGEPVDDLLLPPDLSMVWSKSGTAEATYYNDSQACRMTAGVNARSSQPADFPTYWKSFVSSLSFCMRGKGYQCTGRDCKY